VSSLLWLCWSDDITEKPGCWHNSVCSTIEGGNETVSSLLWLCWLDDHHREALDPTCRACMSGSTPAATPWPSGLDQSFSTAHTCE